MEEATVIGVAFAAIMLGQGLVRVIEHLLKERAKTRKKESGVVEAHPDCEAACLAKVEEIQREIHSLAQDLLNDLRSTQAERINDLKAMADDYKMDAAKSRGAVRDLAVAVREAGLGVEVEGEGE